MFRIRHAVATAAALALSAQACFAAELERGFAHGEQRTSAFAGFSLNLRLDTGRRERPTARLQLTTMRSATQAGGTAPAMRAPGLELGLDRRGGAMFGVAGRDAARMRDQLGISGTTTLILVGGAILVVAVLASVAAAMPKPGPHEGAFD